MSDAKSANIGKNQEANSRKHNNGLKWRTLDFSNGRAAFVHYPGGGGKLRRYYRRKLIPRFTIGKKAGSQRHTWVRQNYSSSLECTNRSVRPPRCLLLSIALVYNFLSTHTCSSRYQFLRLSIAFDHRSDEIIKDTDTIFPSFSFLSLLLRLFSC